jgi:hypothetical protein
MSRQAGKLNVEGRTWNLELGTYRPQYDTAKQKPLGKSYRSI